MGKIRKVMITIINSNDNKINSIDQMSNDNNDNRYMSYNNTAVLQQFLLDLFFSQLVCPFTLEILFLYNKVDSLTFFFLFQYCRITRSYYMYLCIMHDVAQYASKRYFRLYGFNGKYLNELMNINCLSGQRNNLCSLSFNTFLKICTLKCIAIDIYFGRWVGGYYSFLLIFLKHQVLLIH